MSIIIRMSIAKIVYRMTDTIAGYYGKRRLDALNRGQPQSDFSLANLGNGLVAFCRVRDIDAPKGMLAAQIRKRADLQTFKIEEVLSQDKVRVETREVLRQADWQSVYLREEEVAAAFKLPQTPHFIIYSHRTETDQIARLTDEQIFNLRSDSLINPNYQQLKALSARLAGVVAEGAAAAKLALIREYVGFDLEQARLSEQGL